MATTESKKLTMKFAGGLVKHLGLQMYSGAVPAIAELIANSWDADSEKVEIEFPFDKPFTSASRIIVKDSGSGMTFDECDEKYLVLGRDRRSIEGDKTAGGRRLLGHKGIGKLAGFGIANVVTVRTVKNGQVTTFKMDYDEIEKKQFGGEYNPVILENRTIDEGNGTEIILENIKLRRSVSEKQFYESMRRRFALTSDKFKVFVNGKELQKFDVDLQFRFPNNDDEKNGIKVQNGWAVEKVGDNEIKWWIGFTQSPIPDEELIGISILTRGKLAQTPWFFDLAGGTTGQLGMRYMVGEIQADFLDDKEDLITTDRAGILWSHPVAEPLKIWGLEKIRQSLSRWVKLREAANLKELDDDELNEQIAGLPDDIRQHAAAALKKIAQIPSLNEKQVVSLAEIVLDGIQNKHILNLIHQINTADIEDRKKLFQLVSDWALMDTILMGIAVKGRLEVIKKFAKLLKEKVKEKPDMHNLLKKDLWLMDPAWDQFRYEHELDRLLVEEFHASESDIREGRRMPDFFCITSGTQAKVIEIKRPGDTAGKKELQQISDYVHFLREYSHNTTDPQNNIDVEGTLIASKIDSRQSEFVKTLRASRIYVMDWDTLLRRAKSLYKNYLDLIVQRNPDGSLAKEFSDTEDLDGA